MDFIHTDIVGLYLIKPFSHEDERGTFVKTFHAGEFAEKGLETNFRESYYSESVKGVIRGMHFQLPPHDHAKLVFAIAGEVQDVVLDLRKESPTFGQYATFQLNEENKYMLYIPHGMAHGFCSLTEKATLFYFTSTVYNKEHDTGISYDSFGFDWPVKSPILSDRDKSFIPFSTFRSPF